MLGQFDAEDYRRDEEEQTVANGEPEAILWIKKKSLLFAWQNILSYENAQWTLEHFYITQHKY